MKSLKKLNLFIVPFPHVGVINICMKEKHDTETEKNTNPSIVFLSTDFRRGANDAWMKYTLKN